MKPVIGVLLGLFLLAGMGQAQEKRGNQKIYKLDQALRLSRYVYENYPFTLFCNCTFVQGRLSSDRCGYVPQKRNFRASQVDFRPLIPPERYGPDFAEWQGAPACKDRSGRPYGGIRCAAEQNPEFARMAADLYNWFPIESELEGLRLGSRIDEVPGEPRLFGDCDVELQGKVLEPRTDIRGDIARTFLYMDLSYPMHAFMTVEQRRTMESWSREDPVDEWECKRATRIARTQGNKNVFVEDACHEARLQGLVSPLPIR